MHGHVNHITPAQIAAHVRNLQTIGDRLEAAGDPSWLPIAQAAATLELLRIGAADVIHQSMPVWIGIDMGTGDRTVFHGENLRDECRAVWGHDRTVFNGGNHAN